MRGLITLRRYQNSISRDRRDLVDDPTKAKRDLDRVTTRKKDAAGRGCSAFNRLARRDAELFQSIMDGNPCLRGFANRDIRQRLASTPHWRHGAKDPQKASSKISRILRRFRAHGLIAKIPRTRRWRVTVYPRRVMGTALYLRNHDLSRAYIRVAA